MVLKVQPFYSAPSVVDSNPHVGLSLDDLSIRFMYVGKVPRDRRFIPNTGVLFKKITRLERYITPVSSYEAIVDNFIFYLILNQLCQETHTRISLNLSWQNIYIYYTCVIFG